MKKLLITSVLIITAVSFFAADATMFLNPFSKPEVPLDDIVKNLTKQYGEPDEKKENSSEDDYLSCDWIEKGFQIELTYNDVVFFLEMAEVEEDENDE